MRQQLREGLDRLAGLVDPAHLESAKRLQQAAWRYQPVERVPVFLLDLCPPEWPRFPYREALDNPEKMLWNELLETYVGLTLKDDRMLAVRAHFGPGVVASLFGARLASIDDETPWVEGLGSSKPFEPWSNAACHY
ncbi:MAG: hypothetical protein KJZ78_10600 [Bryobacteraceae bacterium]|nr:hypothetical protein [Bryobacteraceae bacterium]